MSRRIEVTPQRFVNITAKMERDISAKMRVAAKQAAMYGRTAVRIQASKTTPEPIASGVYKDSWEVIDTATGAKIANYTPQSFFVEVGRKPGTNPPLDPLLLWLKQKRFRVRTKRMFSHKRIPRSRVAKEQVLRSTAFAIQRIIKERGVAPRFVMQRTIPNIAKFYKKALRSQLKGFLVK